MKVQKSEVVLFTTGIGCALFLLVGLFILFGIDTTPDVASLASITYHPSNFQTFPTDWTCTLRSESDTNTYANTTCAGSTQLITGGCQWDDWDTFLIEDRPEGNGWACAREGTAGSVTATAICCE